MSEPTRDGYNIDAAFNACGREEMAKMMARNWFESELDTCGVDCFLRFGNRQNIIAVDPFRVSHGSRICTHIRK